jgi:20S proteasome subunit beta 6
MLMILVTDTCAIGQCGFQGDARVLLQNVKAKIRIYEHQHMEQPTAPAIAAMLSTMLYYKYPLYCNFFLNTFKRRFFPYYVYNIVAGLDGDGKGSVFSYDPVGSYDQVPMVCYGSAQNLIQPFLDNQIRRPHIKVNSRSFILFGSMFFKGRCCSKNDP